MRHTLTELRDILDKEKVFFALGLVKQLFPDPNYSALKVNVELWPETKIVSCRMTWENVGPNSGDYYFPAVGDLVLVCFVDADPEDGYIIRRLSSQEDTIPVNARTGNKVSKTKSGDQYWITSDTRINLSKGDTPPSENVVLGQELKTFLSSLIDLISMIADSTASNLPPSAPSLGAIRAQLELLKISPLGDDKLLSDNTFVD